MKKIYYLFLLNFIVISCNYFIIMQIDKKEIEYNNRINNIHALSEKVKNFSRIYKNIPFLKERIKFLNKCNKEEFLNFVKKYSNIKNININNIDIKDNEISFSFYSTKEENLTAFLNVLFNKSPVLVFIKLFDIKKKESIFVAKVIVEILEIQINKKSDLNISFDNDFKLIDNDIFPKCVIDSGSDKSVLIGDLWFSEGDKYQRFIIKTITTDEIVFEEPILRKKVILKVGEGNKICL